MGWIIKTLTYLIWVCSFAKFLDELVMVAIASESPFRSRQTWHWGIITEAMIRRSRWQPALDRGQGGAARLVGLAKHHCGSRSPQWRIHS